MYRGTPSRRSSSYSYNRTGLDGAMANEYGPPQHAGHQFQNGFQYRRRFGLHSSFASSTIQNSQFSNASSPMHNWQDSFRREEALNNATRDNNLFMRDSTMQDQTSGRVVDPVPALSFINRLQESQRLTTVPTMKEVDRLPASLKSSFGDKSDDWYAHINKLELDVFQKHAFNSMQCYFAIKGSLKGAAQRALYNLESQLDTPKWVDFMSSWFCPEYEDWVGIARTVPFCNLRYSFRCALIYRYFHYLFQSGDPEQVFENFRKAVQNPQESVVTLSVTVHVRKLCSM